MCLYIKLFALYWDLYEEITTVFLFYCELNQYLTNLTYEIDNNYMQYKMSKNKICESSLCTQALELIFILWINLQSQAN